MASLPMVASGGGGELTHEQKSVTLSASYQTFTFDNMTKIGYLFALTSDNYFGLWVRNDDDSVTSLSGNHFNYGSVSQITDNTVTIKWNNNKGTTLTAMGM